jgi:DNA-binding XRE family transcriptional regulator
MAYQIGKCLLSVRLRQFGMTQAELARRLGIERQQVNKWVKGRQRMSLETSKNVATVLNLHIDDLFEWIPRRD